MRTRKVKTIIISAASLIVIAYTMYNTTLGKDVGFNEIITIALLIMLFFDNITWGNKREKDGILQAEELGQKITEKSSKISYFILLFAILIAVTVEQLINGTVSIFLLTVLGLGMIILPIVEYMIAKNYQ